MVENKEPLEASVIDIDGPINNDYLDDLSIFGGNQHTILSQNFQGGNLKYVFGGGTLDLSQAKLAPGKIYLEVKAVFGGVKIRVPKEWDVHFERSVAIFGSFIDKRKTRFSEPSESQLIIVSKFIFGGGELSTV